MDYLIISEFGKPANVVAVYLETPKGLICYSADKGFAESENAFHRVFSKKVRSVSGFTYYDKETGKYEGQDKTRIDKIIEGFDERAK